MRHTTSFIAAGIVAAAIAIPAAALDISGAGATFPYPIYAKWADAYKKDSGLNLNYQSIGSGGGIKQITARTVTFGASDMPLQSAELDKIGVIQFPTVLGGVVPVGKSRRHQERRDHARWSDAGEDLPGRSQELGRSRRSPSSIRTSSCRSRRSP